MSTIAARRAMTRSGRVALFLVFMAGVVCTLVACFVLLADQLTASETTDDQDILSCQVRGADSVYGYSTWSWLPPGKVCHYPDGTNGRPHVRGELFMVAVIGGGIVLSQWSLRRFVVANMRDRER